MTDPLVVALSRLIVDIDDPDLQTLVDNVPAEAKISCWMKSKENDPISLPFHKIKSPVRILEQLPLIYQKKILQLAKSKSKKEKRQALVALYLFHYALPMIHEVEKRSKPNIYLRTKPRPTEDPKKKTTGYLSILNHETLYTPIHYELVFSLVDQ